MLPYILGFVGGLALLTSKGINNAAANQLGLMRGTVLNYLTGTLVAGALALTFGGLSSWAVYGQIPWYYFLAGIMGLVAMLLSNATLHKLPVIHSTALILATQMSAALALDYWLFGMGSAMKLLGAGIILVALVWDQALLSRRD